MSNSESVGKKIVEALKKQAENIEVSDNVDFNESESINLSNNDNTYAPERNDMFTDPISSPRKPNSNFFDDIEETNTPFYAETPSQSVVEAPTEEFEMPANIAVLKKLISQLPSGVSRHTGAQIIKQTMEALGISMKSVLQDAQQVQEGLKISARECQASIQEYKKQILALEKQSQGYQKQYSALNDLISLFIQTTK